MNKNQITLIVIGFVFLALLATNPSTEEHKEVIKKEINKSIENDNIATNEFQKLGQKLGESIGGVMIDNMVERPNLLIFSITYLKGNAYIKGDIPITIGILGQVLLNQKYDKDLKKFVGITSGAESAKAEAIAQYKPALAEVKIGTQIWETKNLDVSTYRNGDIIPQITDTIAWKNLTTGAWCYYNNDSTQYAKYGKLYNWYAVNDPRGLVPIGWHVPNDDDWATLEINLGGYEIAGGKMKEVGTLNWLSPNTEATNESGFSGLPGGARLHNNGAFDGGVGYGGVWWSSTNVPFDPNFLGANFAWSHYLIYDRGMLSSKRWYPSFSWKLYFNRKSGFSVRLLKD